MKRITALALMLIVLLSTVNAMTFAEFISKVFTQSDAKRDAELTERYDKWDLYDKFGMLIPRIDLTMNVPAYNKTTYEDTTLDLVYENEYESYNAVVSIVQQLPSNTDITASMTYADYSKYRQYGVENTEGYKTGQFKVSVTQYLWGTNEGYHDLKRWLNSRETRKVNAGNNKLYILKSAYVHYIDYLIAEREYELNKGQEARYRDIFQATENSYRMGLVDVINYNRIKKRYKFYEIDYRDSEANLVNERSRMKAFLNEDPVFLEKEIIVISDSIFEDEKPEQKSRQLHRQLDNAYRDYKTAKSYYEPKAYGYVESVYEGSGESKIDGMERTSITAGLGLSIPIGNLSTVSKLKKEKINYLITKNSYQDQMETINEDFSKILSDLKNDYIKIELYKQIIPSLKQNYTASISRFTIGAISLQELMDIEDEYITAEMEYLGVLKSYHLNVMEASEYVGNVDKILEGLL